MKSFRTATETFRRYRIALLVALSFSLFPGLSLAAKDMLVDMSGKLPRQGRVVLRSGMAWLDETTPTFYRLSSALAKELQDRGLTVVSVKASELDPMPKTPLPNKQSARKGPRKVAAQSGPTEEAAASKASELGKSGQLPKLALRTYATPDSDADLSESVRSITAPDVTRALYARSQQQGRPIVHAFAIPGRMPKELPHDATIADYAIIIRFAAVQTWAAAPNPHPFGPGVMVAATSIGGTGALGFGTPAQPAPPGHSTYGTPGGYARGYEGWGRNDFWHRDSDFNQRDYQFKHGPQPQYATPPSGLSGSRSGQQQRQFGVGPLHGREHVATVGWHLILLEGYDLEQIRNGKPPARIWQASVRAPGEPEALPNSLPKMIHAVFAAKPQ